MRTHDLPCRRFGAPIGQSAASTADRDPPERSDAGVCCGTGESCPGKQREGEPQAPENHAAKIQARRLDSPSAPVARALDGPDGWRLGHVSFPESQRAPTGGNKADSGATDLTVLLAKAAEGDSDAWCQITTRFTKLLWAVARSYRLGAQDSADVVQTTWLRLVDNLRAIENPDALPGWLATTARREAISLLRRRTHASPRLEADRSSIRTDNFLPECDTGLLERERDAQLWRCVGQLPEKDQRMLRILMSCDRPSYAGVAAALDVPVGSIGPTRLRALQRLRRILTASGYHFQTPA
jgi:RNA polymerase sigma factor (sigma-70 family)